MSNADHAAMVDGDILLFTLPQSAYIYRKSRTAHAPSNFLEVGVRLLETGEDAAIGDRNFRSRLYHIWHIGRERVKAQLFRHIINLTYSEHLN